MAWQGGQPDISTVARMVLNDWQRGKIPYYVQPPDSMVCHTGSVNSLCHTVVVVVVVVVVVCCRCRRRCRRRCRCCLLFVV